MCKSNVLGISPAALKRQLKEDRKANRPGAGWSEEGGSTYYTNGYYIIRLDGIPFQDAALHLGLGYEDSPGDHEKNLKRIWDTFRPSDYTPAHVTRWFKDFQKVGVKKPMPARIITNETEACLIQQKYLDIFEGCTITMKGRNSGIRVECGYMEAYILPVRCKDEEYAIMRAICEAEKED